MAATKLTLSADKDTIELAKRIASESNISVSKLFKKMLNEVAKKKTTKDPLLEKLKNAEMPDWVKQLTVVDKPTPDFDHKAEYGKYLEEKYGA
ncbi:DUF6364 family protein [Mucilaginibacter sp. UR6-1]|uniref:DUF6364 family protein n=1 Tax=Mucilaginibacter sp. UR6-1 TaxID=1435643 RepID=UPI001E4DC4CD|nr:DUF6364 family protein [Mucilaginibacter sp. UR6-1]MCC8410961.1 DUF6364 family protein [Mucilaginibacter sp. UR6-1]